MSVEVRWLRHRLTDSVAACEELRFQLEAQIGARLNAEAEAEAARQIAFFWLMAASLQHETMQADDDIADLSRFMVLTPEQQAEVWRLHRIRWEAMEAIVEKALTGQGFLP